MTSKRAWLVAGSFLAILLLAILLGMSDMKQLASRAADISLLWCGVSVAAALASYAAAGLAQERLLAGVGHVLPTWTTVRSVGLSIAVNRHVRSGGAAGIATLTWLLRGHGVTLGAVVVTSLAAVLATNALFTSLFFTGVVATLVGEGELEARQLVAYTGVALVFALGLVGAWAALALSRVRSAWTGVATRVAAALGRRFDRPSWAPRLSAFLDQVAGQSLDLLARDRTGRRAWGWIALRIGTSLFALWACVRAAGLDLPLGTLVLGYTAAKVAGVLSIVPAGLGLVEGGMVSVFVAFGIPYETALLVALVNRVTYHVAPAVIALLVGGPLLREARRRGPAPV